MYFWVYSEFYHWNVAIPLGGRPRSPLNTIFTITK